MTKTKPKKYRTKRKKGGKGISDLFKGNKEKEIPDLEKKNKNSGDITLRISNYKDLIKNLEKQLKIYRTIDDKLGTDYISSYEKNKTITAIKYLEIVIHKQKQSKQSEIIDKDNFNKAYEIIKNVIAQEKNKKILADIIRILSTINTLSEKQFKKEILKLLDNLNTSIINEDIVKLINDLKNKINDNLKDDIMISFLKLSSIQTDIQNLQEQIKSENVNLLEDAKTEAAVASASAASVLDTIVLPEEPEEPEKSGLFSAAKRLYTETSNVIKTNTDALKTQIKRKLQSLSSKKAISLPLSLPLPLTDLKPELPKDIYKMKQVSRQIDYSFTTNIEANSELLFSRLKTFIFLDIKNYITYLHNNYDNDNDSKCQTDLNKLMFIFVAFIHFLKNNTIYNYMIVNYKLFKYLYNLEPIPDSIINAFKTVQTRNDLIADIISIIELMLMSDYLNLNYLYGQICINVYLYETKKNGNILSNNHIPNKIDSILHFIMRLFTNTLCYYLNNIRYYSYIETQPAYQAYKQIYTNSSSLNIVDLGDFQEERIYLNLSKNIIDKDLNTLLSNLFYDKLDCVYDRIHFGGVVEPIELANMSFDNPLYLLNHTIMDSCHLSNFYKVVTKQVFNKGQKGYLGILKDDIEKIFTEYSKQS